MMKWFSRQKDSQPPKTFDGMIEAVRYSPDGTLQVARIYERRGPTWSDRVLITREEMIRRMKAGQKFVTGQRIERLASTFEVKSTVRLTSLDGVEALRSVGDAGQRDQLDAPLF